MSRLKLVALIVHDDDIDTGALMVMAICGTFHYAGVVPGTKDARESGHWKLEERWDAPALTDDMPEEWKRLRDSRLVGREPTLRLSGCHLILEATGHRLAMVQSATLGLDCSLVETFQGGDVLTLVRTHTADIGVSLLRHGQLVVAVGAVTATPLGSGVSVQAEQVLDDPADTRELLMRHGRWVDVSVWGDTVRLGRGGTVVLGDYKVTVLRCVQDGVPGQNESVAISREGLCTHDAALRSAELIANAGLRMVQWPRPVFPDDHTPDSAA